MGKAIAYFRVSTDKQGERGLGMQAQQFAVNEYITKNGLELIAEFKEVESGKNSERPKFAEAKERCIEEGAILLIAKLDRLARDLHFLTGLLKDDRFDFKALDMPEASRFEFHIRGALAEEEARLISERTKAGLARSKKPLGSANPIIKAKAIAKRQRLAKEFREEYRALVEFLKQTSEKLSYAQIAEHLNSKGRLTRLGRPWSYTTVKRLFESFE